MARAPPPANRRKHRNCWAGWPTLFVDIIQLRPPRSSRFSKAGDSGCGYLGVLISYAAERIIPSHIPNLHLRQAKAHSPRPAHVPPTHNPESCSTQIHIPASHHLCPNPTLPADYDQINIPSASFHPQYLHMFII